MRGFSAFRTSRIARLEAIHAKERKATRKEKEAAKKAAEAAGRKYVDAEEREDQALFDDGEGTDPMWALRKHDSRSRGILKGKWKMDDWEQFYDAGLTPDIIYNLNQLLDNYLGHFHVSGHFYYPPGAVREWHTNIGEGGLGWRAYIVRKSHFRPAAGDQTRFSKSTSNRSVLRVMHPRTKEVVTIPDLDEMAINIFKVTKEPPLWHCVASEGAHRFSVGMKLTDVDVFHLLVDAGRAVDGDGRLRSERWLLADHWEREEQKQLEKAQEEAALAEAKAKAKAGGGGDADGGGGGDGGSDGDAGGDAGDELELI